MTEWLTERSRDGGLDEVRLPSGDGRMWLCGKHLVGPDPDAVLERTGASMVVCLNEIGELVSRYPDYVDWLRTNRGGRAHWVPVHDMHAPVVDEFAELIGSLRERVDRGEGIVVHCGAGIGRAGTVAAGVLMSMGSSLDDALVHIAASRPGAGPQTREQDELLASYALFLSS